MAGEAYNYSVIHKDGRIDPRKPEGRDGVIKLDDHIVYNQASSKLPSQMAGEKLLDAPAAGQFQIRVDGPEGTFFLEWEQYRAGQPIVYPRPAKK